MSEIKEKVIGGRVVSFASIPEELTVGHWFNEYPTGCYIECHMDGDAENALDEWIMKNYPGIEEETFFIEIDY